MRENRLNDLDSKGWMKFTKSWFVHNPSPRKKDEVLHPAKYPESMVEEFIRFFTKEGQVVFDPFLGTGSTLVACENSSRVGIGIELQEKYGEIARGRAGSQKVIVGDSFKVREIWQENNLPKIDFLITSPPYGAMLGKKGLVQKEREEKSLDVKYSDDKNDLGNIEDYDLFVSKLIELFVEIKELMKDKAYLVVILQNYREGPSFRTLAWDFAAEMKKHFILSGVKLWCQDNKTLYPYGYKYSFVPNIHHHYCLIFRVNDEKRENFIK